MSARYRRGRRLDGRGRDGWGLDVHSTSRTGGAASGLTGGTGGQGATLQVNLQGLAPTVGGLAVLVEGSNEPETATSASSQATNCTRTPHTASKPKAIPVTVA
jgi:hypothetical protein